MSISVDKTYDVLRGAADSLQLYAQNKEESEGPALLNIFQDI
jgi:hypothetical protein